MRTRINNVWLELALITADLLAVTQSMLLTNEVELHRAEPRTLPYRLLHIAARITRLPTQSVPPPRRALALGARAHQSIHTTATDPLPA